MDSYIEIAYDIAVGEAKKIDDIADDVAKQQKKLKTLIDDLADAWNGDAALRYRAECTETYQRMSKNIKYMRNIASGIRETASAYRDIELAKQKTSEK